MKALESVAAFANTKGGTLLRAFLFAAARGHVRLDADDRLDLGLLAGFIKFNRAEHVAVVGQRRRRHVALLRRVDEIFDAARAVQQAVVNEKNVSTIKKKIS